MNILNTPFHEITFENVVAFCEAGNLESAVLDYKKTMPRDLSKHFATFSNTHGGLIIIGVEEDSTGKPKSYNGVDFESKLIDQVHQFAANVNPFPRYNVRETNEVSGKVFILIKIAEGDQPPYVTNNDPTVRLRTGNVSTPLRNPDSRELEKLYEKRNSAREIRQRVIEHSDRIYDSALARAVEEWEVKRKNEPHQVNEKKVGETMTPYRVTIMPVSPSEPIADYRIIKRDLNKYRVQTNYLGDFPDLTVETTPGGIMFGNWRWTDSEFRYGMVTETGVIDSINDVLNVSRSDKRSREMWMGHLIGYLVRQLDVAKNFYNLVGFNGLIVCKISLRDAKDIVVYPPVPQGWNLSPLHEYQSTKLDNYDWELPELDTFKLNDVESITAIVTDLIDRFYWDFNMGTPNSDAIREYLQQFGWKLPPTKEG